MYTLQLDLLMYFCPPMKETGNPIRLTRTLLIPFAPYNDAAIYSAKIDTHPLHEGFILKNVVWDMDRERFTAESSFVHHDMPIACIGDELASWIAIGWQLGTFIDDYDRDIADAEDYGEDEEETAGDSPMVAEYDTDDPDELMPTLPPRQRSKSFNRLFRALIRTICQDHRGTSTAYAMWKTKRFFTEKQLKDNDTKPAQQFLQAKEEFDSMDFSEQYDWEERILRTLPRLDRVVSAYTSSTSPR